MLKSLCGPEKKADLSSGEDTGRKSWKGCEESEMLVSIPYQYTSNCFLGVSHGQIIAYAVCFVINHIMQGAAFRNLFNGDVVGFINRLPSTFLSFFSSGFLQKFLAGEIRFCRRELFRLAIYGMYRGEGPPRYVCSASG